MAKIQLLNKISPIGLKQFSADYEIGDAVTAPDAIMVRSAAMHDMEFGPELKAIARAGAGVNNIPVEACANKGIVVFNTPGANANGVKELAIAALMLASRDIVGGVKWASTLTEDVAKSVEKGKSAFAGCEVMGKTLGVIGLGAIGGLVANAAKSLGMNVIGCDPYITIDGAWHLSRAIQKASTYDEIYEQSDYITLHVPATPTTKNMINKDTIAKMKDGVRILNLSRADLVNIDDLKEALASGKVASYVTDFPTEDSINVKGIVAIPHLGASTEESEDNCAVMAAREIMDFLENGNIKNSVNYPNVQMPRTAEHRVVILHKNIPNMISQITGAMAAQNINIENLVNASKGDFACTIAETNTPMTETMLLNIAAVEGIIRVIKIA
ncbi:MAG: 3-phosphoglycerate dehydrogenase [Clostridia bacterium]|nr:3-phosphoglycerate dehydrogenase [Clostridia bacterium]